MSLKSTADFVLRLLTKKKARDAYVFEHIRNGVAFQLRAMRDERGWSQDDLAKAAKTGRTTITRLENPNNDRLTLKTLLGLASALDVALLIKFVPFSRLVKEYDDVSPEALSAASIDKEKRRLTAWAAAKDRAEAANNTADFVPRIPLREVPTTTTQTRLFEDENLPRWIPPRPLRVVGDYDGTGLKSVEGGQTEGTERILRDGTNY